MKSLHAFPAHVLTVFAAAVLFLVIAVAIVWPTKSSRLLIEDEKTPSLVLAALTHLSTDQYKVLVQRERKRLRDEPLDITALNNLAILDRISGNNEEATALLLEASSRTLHDPLAQFTAMKNGIDRADYVTAFRHFDGLLTTLPAAASEVFPMVAPILADNGAVDAMAAELARDPPWRRKFLDYLDKGNTASTISYQLIVAMRKSGAQGTGADLQAILSKLMNAGQYDQAFYIWLDSLDPAELLKVGGLYDGDFTLPTGNRYFDWNIYPPPNSTVTIMASKSGRGQLRLEFAKSEAAFDGVFQFLRLTPGNYNFVGNWGSNGFTAVQGLVWRLKCVESGALAGESEHFKTSVVQSSFTFTVTIPANGCSTQRLDLVSASVLTLDLPLDGEIFFSDLSVTQASDANQ
ncbi:MAG: hypothetical protein ABI230_01015 [Aestuariivirga sp.]